MGNKSGLLQNASGQTTTLLLKLLLLLIRRPRQFILGSICLVDLLFFAFVLIGHPGCAAKQANRHEQGSKYNRYCLLHIAPSLV
jgi:hypothetical protein